MKLMGVDVGYSEVRRTTGIACLAGDRLSLGRAFTNWESREAQIPSGFQATVIALDGPLVPKGAAEGMRRHCESVFVRAPFHNRCKPALSHHGLGLALRNASREACAQFSRTLTPLALTEGGTVSRTGPVVEAFPNAFLGVLMPERELMGAPKLKRGQRFDWLYKQLVTTGRLETVLSRSVDLPGVVWRRLRAETDHELRAALICLLTAAFAERGTAAVIGDAESGWFWLPPSPVWQPWAVQGLEGATRNIDAKAARVVEAL